MSPVRPGNIRGPAGSCNAWRANLEPAGAGHSRTGVDAQAWPDRLAV